MNFWKNAKEEEIENLDSVTSKLRIWSGYLCMMLWKLSLHKIHLQSSCNVKFENAQNAKSEKSNLIEFLLQKCNRWWNTFKWSHGVFLKLEMDWLYSEFPKGHVCFLKWVWWKLAKWFCNSECLNCWWWFRKFTKIKWNLLEWQNTNA